MLIGSISGAFCGCHFWSFGDRDGLRAQNRWDRAGVRDRCFGGDVVAECQEDFVGPALQLCNWLEGVGHRREVGELAVAARDFGRVGECEADRVGAYGGDDFDESGWWWSSAADPSLCVSAHFRCTVARTSIFVRWCRAFL